MRVSCGPLLFRRVAVPVAVSAAVPPNYSNIPYKKERDDASRFDMKKKKDSTQFTSSALLASPSPLSRSLQHSSLRSEAVLPPAPMRSTFISPSRSVTSFNSNYKIKSFRHSVCVSSDVSMRPLQFLSFHHHNHHAGGAGAAAARNPKKQVEQAPGFGERLRDSLSCRWAAKFYGQVTFGPRNYPYPSSRWLARRFKMKKHKIVKRFRFRRYKLAAVANLPFAKMIRVGMLPELKSSKSKKGDAVDAGLSAQLVSAAKTTSGGKAKGKRSRPKSKYQV